MGGARLAVYAVLLVLIAGLAAWEFQQTEGPPQQDVDLVYCTAPSHAGGLVDAAVSLGLAGRGHHAGSLLVRGRDLSPGLWRAEQPDAFNLACGAYAAAHLPGQASSAGQDGGKTMAGILLPVVVGALLTLMAADFRAEGDRRWALADELRANWQAFSESARSFADALARPAGGKRSSADLDARRREFTATLRKVRAHYGGRESARRLREALDGRNGILGEKGIAANWDQGESEKSAQHEKVLDALGEGEKYMSEIAESLERRIWSRPRK